MNSRTYVTYKYNTERIIIILWYILNSRNQHLQHRENFDYFIIHLKSAWNLKMNHLDNSTFSHHKLFHLPLSELLSHLVILLWFQDRLGILLHYCKFSELKSKFLIWYRNHNQRAKEKIKSLFTVETLCFRASVIYVNCYKRAQFQTYINFALSWAP